ncbi:MAG: rod shape-determining protein RodA [Gammaproteobacteria bacterium]
MINLSQLFPTRKKVETHLLRRLHIDGPLLLGLLALTAVGFVILYSASSHNQAILTRQALRFALAYSVMFICAQIPPHTYDRWSIWIFLVTLLMLGSVMILGEISKGAQRWLDLGLIRFQPSEMMKLALPLGLAWFLKDKSLPPSFSTVCMAGLIIMIPCAIIAEQPDLGTALMIFISGVFVLFLAGISWRYMSALSIMVLASIPLLWHYMHDYQKQRVLTFLKPERDPLGHGYHIIQSKIAIGSGGFFGKGWLNGTQSHLHFLPEHATDFIFGVAGEEFGLLGSLVLITLYLYIVMRCLYMSSQAQGTFTRMLSGSLALGFFFSMFVNLGMVTGLLPVVGLPLPLVSYGGTSVVTLMAGFGILMSIHSHRNLLAK